MTLSPQPTDNYIYDGNAEADLAEFLRFTSDHDMSSEAWGVYVEDGVSATTSKPFPVLEPRTVKIPPLIVGKDSYGSNGKKFRYGPPPRYLPPMEPGLLSGARVPWTLSPSDHAVSGPCLCSPPGWMWRPRPSWSSTRHILVYAGSCTDGSLESVVSFIARPFPGIVQVHSVAHKTAPLFYSPNTVNSECSNLTLINFAVALTVLT